MRAAGVMTWVLLTGVARADLLDVPVGARATGRAGAGLLSTDDGAALFYNPASMARRLTARVQLGLAASRRAADFASAATFPTGDPPAVESVAGVRLLPWGGAEVGIGDRLVVGGALFAPTGASFVYPTAPPTFNPMSDDRAAFPARYAATRFEARQLGGGVGAAVRVLPWLAVGVSLLAYRVDVEHARATWGGPPGGQALGDLTPAYDMTFSVSASDPFVPGAAAGVVVAPLDLPLELALSATWSDGAHLEGAPALAGSRGAGSASAQVASDAAARLDLDRPPRLRAGVRLLLRRVALEVDGELAPASRATPTWSVTGVGVSREGEEATPISSVALGPTLSGSWTVRGALDVDVIPAALALTAGYAYSRRAAEAPSPGFPDGDGHTAALGAEGRVAGATVTLGVAQTWIPRRRSGGLEVVGSPGTPAAEGRLGAGGTVVALDVEVELP